MARQIDWDAIKRDYRTGAFTDQELADKHAVPRETISRRRKKDRAKDENDWAQDLTEAVRTATNAMLMKEHVTQKITEGHEKVTDVILATAEVNKQVILGHRSDLQAARTVAQSLLVELSNAALLADDMERLAEILAGEGAEPRDVNEARKVVARALGIGSRIQGIKALTDALAKLHDGERTAFSIKDSSPEENSNSLSSLLKQVSRSALPVAKVVPEEDDESD